MLSLDDQDAKPPLDGNNANNDQSRELSSIFPLPPMRYIKLYTDQNLKNKCTPPPPKPFPNNGNFLMFGQTIAIDDTIIRSLESQGLRRLYPREYDHKKELKKINASILVNFLDLIDVLIRCPDTPKREEKCNDIQLCFITVCRLLPRNFVDVKPNIGSLFTFQMHHLINELRPHQARESIRVALQFQKKQRMETTNRLNKHIERVQEMVKSACDSISDRNIDTIIQETLPENFQRPRKKKSTTTTTSSFATGTLSSSNGGSTFHSSDSSSEDFNEPANLTERVTRNLQQDAIMCDLVDEIF